jgi:type VI secretion system secreted protein Hcp
MATDMFLKVNGIKGESTDSKHKGEIDILGFSLGVTNQGSFSMGPGGGAGKASVSDLMVTKYVDASSPDLFKACCTGQHIDQVVLTVRKAGTNPLEYTVITLKQVLVSQVRPTGSKDGDHLSEEVAFNFGEIHIDYDTQNEKGAKGDHFATAYSFNTNAVV